MGFFDFFKKKKTNGRLKDLPPVMRQAYSVLFPKGQTDQERQLDELCDHYGSKYQRDDFFSNDSHNLLLSLKSKENGNENVYLFLAAALKKSLGHKYHWGDSISKQKIKSNIVNLPMNGNEVDYPFMDTIISGIKKRIIANLKSFIDKEHQAYLEVTK